MNTSNGNGYASDDQFFQHCERRYTDVTVPGLGKVRIRSLTDREQRKIQENAERDADGTINLKYLFADRAIACIVDEDGDDRFGDIHRERLADMDYAITRTLLDEMLKHCQDGPYTEPDEDLKKSSTVTTDSTPSSG